MRIDLPTAGIAYRHVESLGGRRNSSGPSPNSGLRSESFRAYADHMATAEFRAGIESLFQLDEPLVIMCAEAVPWRCHRNMISDELCRRGLEVVHLISEGSQKEHHLSPLAKDCGDHLEYPLAQRNITF